MEEEKFVELIKEIRPILQKYGAKNVVIGIDNEDGAFHGCYGAENEYGNPYIVGKAALSCARLYQGAREKLFKGLEAIALGHKS